MFPSFLGLKPMFEPQCSQTWTRRSNTLSSTLFIYLEPNATPNALSAVCWDPQMWRNRIPYLRLDCVFSLLSIAILIKKTQLALFYTLSASVWFTQTVVDVSIKRRNDSWFAYSLLWGLLTSIFTTVQWWRFSVILPAKTRSVSILKCSH